MASGLPVVGTSSAFGGIEAGPGDGVRVADPPEEFAEAVAGMLLDPRRRTELGTQARAFVEREHRWDRHGAALEALLLDLVARRARGAA